MLELVATEVSIAGAFAEPHALDALFPAGAFRCRVAPDEAMFVREPGVVGRLVRDAGAVTAGDPHAVVIDATDGWSVWTLVGDAAADAFSRLSALRPDDGYAQGDIAHVPARVIAEHDRLHLFVPATLGEYLRVRILARCANLGLTQRDEPAAWTATGGI